MPSQLVTSSERAFEQFCRENHLPFEKICEAATPRPDYKVRVADSDVIFEVKELDGDGKARCREIGKHIRGKIHDGRKQVRWAAEQGIATVLLIFNENEIDRKFRFGTEDHDFTTAMYGEYTLNLARNGRGVLDAFYGRNQSMREDWNVEFSAVGRLEFECGRVTVTLFENVFSQIALPYDRLPPYFLVQRIAINSGNVVTTESDV